MLNTKTPVGYAVQPKGSTAKPLVTTSQKKEFAVGV